MAVRTSARETRRDIACKTLKLIKDLITHYKIKNLHGLQTGQRHRRQPAVSQHACEAGLSHFHTADPGEQISKKDLFYYVYGILHSPDYRERYADNLSKELPRIPAMKKAADFWAFSKAGRALADLHLNYETIAPYPLTIEANGALTDADYRVVKMKFAKKGDKTKVIYYHRITLKAFPKRPGTMWSTT